MIDSIIIESELSKLKQLNQQYTNSLKHSYCGTFINHPAYIDIVGWHRIGCHVPVYWIVANAWLSYHWYFIGPGRFELAS